MGISLWALVCWLVDWQASLLRWLRSAALKMSSGMGGFSCIVGIAGCQFMYTTRLAHLVCLLFCSLEMGYLAKLLQLLILADLGYPCRILHIYIVPGLTV